jgi:hypothetical protein
MDWRTLKMEKLFIQTEDGVREYTAEEYAQNKLDKEAEKLYLERLEQNKIKKEQLLARLGITEDEAKLLLS